VIHVAARVALGPLLYRQATRLRRSVVPLPEPPGPRKGLEGAGPRRLRLLIAGDSSAAGVGAPTQEEAFARPLARAVAARIGGAVSWQLVARPGLTSAALLEHLRSTPVESADLALVVIGVNDITHEVPQALALRQRLHIVHWLQAHCGVQHVVFPALPDMGRFPALPQPLRWYAGLHARRANRAQARWAARHAHVSHVAMDGVTDARLFSEDGFHPAPALYARVVNRLAEHIGAHMGESVRKPPAALAPDGAAHTEAPGPRMRGARATSEARRSAPARPTAT
jgi:lysophospholipase L1-like esterase